MSQWLQRLGHSVRNPATANFPKKPLIYRQLDDINTLNIVHVAGTKGKGSTCAFTESFLRAHGRRTGFPRKTGLYTSPHLIVPEERIRINSVPLSRDLLAKYFFEVYDRLPQLAEEYDVSRGPVERGPRYLQLWALFAFHVFVREGVEAAIFETHNGGEYDATTVVTKPVVTAITTLGMDHIDMLGPTIENIAWHKSGIYKSGSVALSTTQQAAPAKVLEERAAAKGEVVNFIGDDERLPPDALNLKPSVQRKNASLALAAAQTWLTKCAPSNTADLTTEDIRTGVEQWQWAGRFQIIEDGKWTWFLDGAHNDMSMAIAAQWFIEATELLEVKGTKVLIFSHINALRDTAALLTSLAVALRKGNAKIEHVIFSTYDESAERHSVREPKSPQLFHDTWESILPETRLWDEPTIQGAIERARTLGSGVNGAQTLITGSQHLVGPALRILQSR